MRHAMRCTARGSGRAFFWRDDARSAVGRLAPAPFASSCVGIFRCPRTSARALAGSDEQRIRRIYSLPDYLEALSVALDEGFRVFVAERNGSVVAGIARFERVSRYGPFVSPRLLLKYNGIVLAPHDSQYPGQPAAWNLQSLAALEQALARLPHARLQFKNRSACKLSRVAHGLRRRARIPRRVVGVGDTQPMHWAAVQGNRKSSGRIEGEIVAFRN